jgi:microcin C transport system permease protein
MAEIDAPPRPQVPPGPAAREPGPPPRRPALSPLNRRRWRNFRSNKRGYWSFWIFLVLFVVTLFAELIANDKPLVILFKGHVYAPVIVTYPETAFGGDFETEADYRDTYLIGLIRDAGGTMVWPPIRYSYDTINRNLPTPAPSPPTWMLTDDQCREAAAKVGGKTCRDIEWNWLGTDNQGRDVVARLIYGFRISVLFGLTLTILSSVIGVAAGAIQGYFGGWTDLIFQRAIEIWSNIPTLYLLIIIASVIEPSFWILLGILLLFSWTALVGVVRAEFLRARNFEYVRAARALGLPNRLIMWRHMLPNAMVATLTFMPFILNGSISTLTSLDFLGFGLPPGSPSLGELLLQGKDNLQAPWLGITGFLVIGIMLSLLIFVGEAVRDAFDPRKTFS